MSHASSGNSSGASGKIAPDVFCDLTIDAARRRATILLREAPIDTPELDARLLVGAVTNLDLTGLSLHASRKLTLDEAERLAASVQRRLAHEPVARILGRKEFWSLDLKLSDATLVPRTDTETLVEAALALHPDKTQPIHFADIGTGSGAILLSLLSMWPNSMGIGLDISLTALRTARDNARALKLDDRAVFVASNYTAALRGSFDLIVSNPPYIASGEIELLAPDVRNFEPRRALDGGADGLDAYRILCTDAARLLRPGGTLAVEVGHRQADEVAALMTATGMTVLPYRNDLAGIARAVCGIRQNA